MTSVRARAGTDSGGWISIPELSDDAERARWATAVTDAVARAHGDRFDPAAAPGIQRVAVDAARDRRESDLLVMGFLPTARPILSRVRVCMVTPPAVGQWREEGFELSPIRTETMGHGMLATRTTDGWLEDSRQVVHEGVFLFTEGTLGIAVVVEPCPALVFDRMQTGLLEIVGSLTVEFDDGRTFTGQRVTELPGSDADTWDIGMHDAA